MISYGAKAMVAGGIQLFLPLEDGFGGGGGGGGKSISSYVSCSGSGFLNQQNHIVIKLSEISHCL